MNVLDENALIFLRVMLALQLRLFMQIYSNVCILYGDIGMNVFYYEKIR